jgi:hypothetical protein
MIINQDIKNLFKLGINDILSSTGLTNLCTLYYKETHDYCNNCLFDRSSNMSSNIYNNTGPIPFDDYTMCPVCMGSGQTLLSDTKKELYLAVISDSKYFMGLPNNLVNIQDIALQIVCSKTNIDNLRSCSYLVINADPIKKYEKIDNGNLIGLGDLDYIIMNWRLV